MTSAKQRLKLAARKLVYTQKGFGVYNNSVPIKSQRSQMNDHYENIYALIRFLDSIKQSDNVMQNRSFREKVILALEQARALQDTVRGFPTLPND